jgi:hypothetical protein
MPYRVGPAPAEGSPAMRDPIELNFHFLKQLLQSREIAA